ncbi:unnamed protein product [Amoebophrya sp. A25]|nr:unnamed protein product [Amoebophrya sp. A25]|eukprot:GSA25T00007491001.1
MGATDIVKTTPMECPAQESMDVVKMPATTPGLRLYPAMCNMEGCHEMPNDSADSSVDVADLKPCYADGCSICSLYLVFPACIGVSGSSEMCCSQMTCACCKVLDCSDAEKRCCTFCNYNNYLIMPRTCVQNQVQVGCVDQRAAFPCTKDVPCLCNYMCINCCADFGCKFACCATVGDLIPRLKEGK